MVQKNETIAIIVSLLVVVILITVLCFCCTQRYLGISSRLSSYSTDDPEKSSTSSTERSPTGPGPASETGSFDVEDKPGGRKRSPSPKSPGSNGSFDVQSRRPSRSGTPQRRDGGFNVGSRAGSRRPSHAGFSQRTDGGFNVRSRPGSRRPSHAGLSQGTDGGFNIGSRTNSRTPIRPRRPENTPLNIPGASNDRVPYIPGPSANERGILRNSSRAGSRGPGRVAFQPGSGGSIVVGNQGGGYTVSDGGFDVVGNGTRLSMTGQTVQPRQRGGHGNDTNTDVPEIASESGSGSSGGFNAR